MGINWSENVGTQNYPVSRLHEHAIAILWDELQYGLERHTPVRVKTVSGEISGDLLDGIARVAVPTHKTPVLGKIPDLALFDQWDNPIRVIEITTSNRDPNKESHFHKAQIDFVEVSVKTPQELATFCWVTVQPYTPKFLKFTRIRGRALSLVARKFGSHAKPDYEVKELCRNLLNCSPESRRQLAAILKGLESPESLLRPISADNPKRDILEKNANSD